MFALKSTSTLDNASSAWFALTRPRRSRPLCFPLFIVVIHDYIIMCMMVCLVPRLLLIQIRSEPYLAVVSPASSSFLPHSDVSLGERSVPRGVCCMPLAIVVSRRGADARWRRQRCSVACGDRDSCRERRCRGCRSWLCC